MKNLKTMRNTMNLTQSELGAVIGLRKSAISKYENGTYPPVPVLIQLAKALDVSTDYLLDLTSIPNSPADSSLSVEQKELLAGYAQTNKTNKKIIRLLLNQELDVYKDI